MSSAKANQTDRSISRRAFLGYGAAAGLAAHTLDSSRAGANAMQDEGGSQVQVLWETPRTLSPLFSTAGAEQQVERLIFGALVKINDQLEAVPDLAETVDVSPDARTYTFTLKEGITFSDGQPLTSRDVAFTFERAADARTGSYWQGRLRPIEGVEAYANQQAETISGLETPDERTVRMTLTEPNAVWLLELANFSGFGILPAHVLGDVPPDALAEHAFSLAPTVGAGAYQFVRYEPDQYLELARNPHYGHGPTPQLDRIFLRILTPDVAIVEMERGNLDLIYDLPTAEVDRLKENAQVEIVEKPGAPTARLQTNLTRPILQDKRVRQAIAHAIDRESIVAGILQGHAEIINHPFTTAWMNPVEGINAYPYDPDRARQLLQEANWDSSQRVDWVFGAGNADLDAYAPIIQQQLQDVGIDVQIVTVEGPEATRRLLELEFDLNINPSGGVFRSDPNESARFFTSQNFTPAGANFSHYANPRVDELFVAGKAEPDPARRKEIYSEIALILNDEVPWIFLWSPNTIMARNRRLAGLSVPAYPRNYLWNAEEWSVTP